MGPMLSGAPLASTPKNLPRGFLSADTETTGCAAAVGGAATGGGIVATPAPEGVPQVDPGALISPQPASAAVTATLLRHAAHDFQVTMPPRPWAGSGSGPRPRAGTP